MNYLLRKLVYTGLVLFICISLFVNCNGSQQATENHNSSESDITDEQDSSQTQQLTTEDDNSPTPEKIKTDSQKLCDSLNEIAAKWAALYQLSILEETKNNDALYLQDKISVLFMQIHDLAEQMKIFDYNENILQLGWMLSDVLDRFNSPAYQDVPTAEMILELINELDNLTEQCKVEK